MDPVSGYHKKQSSSSSSHFALKRHGRDSSAAMDIEDSPSNRMSWLYRMLSTIHLSGGSYAYSPESRSWLARRVDSADGVAVRDRTISTWWENQSGNGMPEPQKLMMPSLPEEQHQEPAGTPAAKERHLSSIIPVLKLQDVLDTPVFLADFRSHLEENYCAQGLNFLEGFRGLMEIDPKADPKKFIKVSRQLYERFVDGAADEMVSIPLELRNRVKDLTNNAVKSKNTSTIDGCFVPLKNIFEEVKKGVLSHMEASLYPRFLKSEDYQEMIAVRFEDDSESKGAVAAYKGPAWENTAGYKSLQIELLDGVDIGRKAWCNLTVDLRTYKSESKGPAAASSSSATPVPSASAGPVPAALVPSPSATSMASSAGGDYELQSNSSEHKVIPWNEHFEFPIASTTQHLKVVVLTRGLIESNVFLGRVIIPIGQIQEHMNTAPNEPLVVKLLPKSSGEKVSGEIRMLLKLSSDEAKDDLHKPMADDEGGFAVTDGIRGLVSKKKKRFKGEGFDLDLTYITDRIIAMGFPSEGLEGVYRNKMEDVQRFLEKRHHLSYKLYNLCSERSYDPAKFKGRVVRIPFDDHNPPNIEQIKEFCIDAHEWLLKHPQNVVAVHCKAGKGRTGTMIASYLEYSKMCDDGRQALTFFGRQRTTNGKGVTIPSQKRYVYYFDYYCRLRRSGLTPPPKSSLFLNEIVLQNIPKKLKSGEVWFTITQNNRKALQYKSKGHVQPRLRVIDNGTGDKKGPTHMIFSFGNKPILLTEDIQLEFQITTKTGKRKLFQLWFNTRYVVSMYAAQEAELRAKGHQVRPAVRSVEKNETPGNDEEKEEEKDDHANEAGEEVEDDFEEEDTSAADEEPDPSVMTGELFSTVNPSNVKEETMHLLLEKRAIDKICKDKKNKSYPADFKLEFIFGATRKATANASRLVADYDALPALAHRESEVPPPPPNSDSFDSLPPFPVRSESLDPLPPPPRSESFDSVPPPPLPTDSPRSSVVSVSSTSSAPAGPPGTAPPSIAAHVRATVVGSTGGQNSPRDRPKVQLNIGKLAKVKL